MTRRATLTTAVNPQDRNREVRRTAWRLALLALAFYFGFIALAVVQGS